VTRIRENANGIVSPSGRRLTVGWYPRTIRPEKDVHGLATPFYAVGKRVDHQLHGDSPKLSRPPCGTMIRTDNILAGESRQGFPWRSMWQSRQSAPRRHRKWK